MSNELESQEFYIELLEQLRAIITERGHNARMETIQMKWELGERLVKEEENFRRFNYGEQMVEKTAKDLEVSAISLWKTVQFYRKFPMATFDEVIEALPGGKEINWGKIQKEVLPQPQEDVQKQEEAKELQKNCLHYELKCTKCGKVFNLEELAEYLKNNEKKKEKP